MWFAVYAVCQEENDCSWQGAVGHLASVCVRLAFARFDLLPVCVCVFTWRGQAALNHCHSQRRRETLMFSHSDTYRTPLSWTLTVLRADACVLGRRAVTSHQTAAPRPLARSPVSPSAIIFPFPFVSRLSDVTLILLWNRHRFNSKGVAYTYDRCVSTCWKMEMCGKPSAPKQTRAGTSAFGVGIDKPPLKKMGFEEKPLLFLWTKSSDKVCTYYYTWKDLTLGFGARKRTWMHHPPSQ